MTIIVKNSTDQSLMISDLGIEVPINAQIDLSELFSVFEIMTSEKLKNYVKDGILIINNGTEDLNINEGLDYITF